MAGPCSPPCIHCSLLILDTGNSFRGQEPNRGSAFDHINALPARSRIHGAPYCFQLAPAMASGSANNRRFLFMGWNESVLEKAVLGSIQVFWAEVKPINSPLVTFSVQF